MTLPRIAIVGAGQVGATAAHLIALKGLGHVTLIDIVDGLAQGKALDLMQSAPIEGFDVSVTGTTDFNALAGHRVVVITAGLARKPGMSRDDLLVANANVVGPIADRIAKVAPEAIIIVVTNPLDLMVALVLKRSGFPRARVMGMAGVLDSARLRAFIAQRLSVLPADVQALVLGSHGDLMVPLPGSITIRGEPVTKFLKPEELDALLQRTKDGGAEIVALLKQGSAFYAPASGVVDMVSAILTDRRAVLPACVRLDGEYGLRETCIGVPVQLGSGGIERVVEVSLSAAEHAALTAAAQEIAQGIAGLTALQAGVH